MSAATPVPRVARKPCPLCTRRLPTVPQVCEPCRASIARLLATIPGLVADALGRAAAYRVQADDGALDPVSRALPAGPVPAISWQPHTTGGSVEAAAPLDLDAVDVAPAAGVLHEWATRWWQPGDPPIGDPAAWLAAHLDRACDHHGAQVAAFATDLRDYAARLRHLARDSRQLLGHCPTEDCGHPLYADPRDQAAACDHCGTTWPRRHWLWLADTLRPIAA